MQPLRLLAALASVFASQATFWAPLTSSVVPFRGTGAPSFTRATTRTCTDHEGKVNTLLAGEVGFTGARRVQNLLVNSAMQGAPGNSALPTSWARVGNDATCNTLIADATPPDGAGRAMQIRMTAAGGFQGAGATYTWPLNALHVVSVRVRVSTGLTASDCHLYLGTATPSSFLLASAATLNAQPKDVWVRYSVQVTVTADTSHFAGFINPGQATGTGFDFTEPQIELVLGQQSQNPAEYVSTGFLAAPFHGAMIDGVQYFEFYNGNTVAANVVTAGVGAAIGKSKNQSAYLPGLSGSYFSSPNAAANQITGDIDLRGDVAMTTWTAAAALNTVIGKDDGATNRCYYLALTVGGILIFSYSPDGTLGSNVTAQSTVAVTFAAGTRHWMRATRSAATGTVTFYTSDDGVTWAQLGAGVATAAGNLFAGTAALNVGARGNGVTSFLGGTIYQACVYNGINGSLAACFTANDYTSGNTFPSSATGETWTLNGGAAIRNFPLLGYISEQQSTNLVLQSENFGTTWTAVGAPTRSAAALRCGAVVLDLLGDTNAAGVDGYTQPITFTADAVKAFSIHFAQNTATSSGFDIRDTTAGITRVFGLITWTAGVPTVTMNIGTLLGVDALQGGVFRARVSTAAVTAANVNQVRIWPANDAVGTVTLTGAIYFGGVQAENNTFCTSYTSTAAATATRNQEQLTYAVANSALPAVGTLYAESLITGASGVLFVASVSDGSINNRVSIFSNGAGTTVGYRVTSGTVSQLANIGVNGEPAATVSKHAVRWSSTDAAAYLNGVLDRGTGAAITPPAALTQINVGVSDTGSASNANGNIRNVKIWKTAASNDAMVKITA